MLVPSVLNEKIKSLYQFSASVIFGGREDFYSKSSYNHVSIVTLIINVICALTVGLAVVTLGVRNSKFTMTTSLYILIYISIFKNQRNSDLVFEEMLKHCIM